MSNRTHPSDSTAFDADSDREWTVTLPATLRSRIDQRLPNTEFDSPEAYVGYVMESLLRELDEQDAHGDDAVDHAGAAATDPGTDSEEFGEATAADHGDPGETITDDTEAMEERLESLGYL
jgi:hypothetical protein